MANVIQIKRSATHSATTAPTNLAVGELGYVQGSKELYICRSTDNTGGTEIIHAALPLDGANTIDTVGEIATGTWAADVIGSSYLPDASTTVEGVVELATDDETNTGTDTSRALTASNLTAWASDTTTAIASGKLPTASTTQVGITVLADSDETNTGTDDTRAVTPDGLNDWEGNTAITSVGTIATGTWNADSIAAGKLPALNSITAPDGDVALNSKKITGLADPEDAQDAATKAYVDAKAQGLDIKDSVVAVSLDELEDVTYAQANNTDGIGATLTCDNANETLVIDGVTPSETERVLLLGQAGNSDAHAENGIYTLTTAAEANTAWVLTRATDFDTNSKVTSAAFTFVEEGTGRANTGWVVSTDNPLTFSGGTFSGVKFTQFSGAGTYTAGSGLELDGAEFGIADKGVTLARMDDMATASIIGRNSANAGPPEVLSAATARSVISVDEAGTDNSTNVTLATVTGNYLSISGQEITAGEVPVSLGGTGLATITSNGVMYGTGAGDVGVTAAGTDGQILVGTTSGAPSWTASPTGLTVDCGTF